MNTLQRSLIGCAIVFVTLAGGRAYGLQTTQAQPLLDAYRTIAAHRFVDLTHTFAPGIPHWPGFPNETVKTLFTYKKDGFVAQQFTHVGQWGTHVDAPAHFAPGGLTVDAIDPSSFLLPLVVIDVHAKVAKNPNYVITMNDVHDWERAHGPIPPHAFVAMRTDWSKRWPNARAMANADAHGIAHYPGWSMPVLHYLYDVRHVTATGHETTDTDPGIAASNGDYRLESWILHHGHYQIEMLAHLDRVPETGALVMIGLPKAGGASGFPVRVIAIVP